MKKHLLNLLIAICIGSATMAQAPSRMSYQSVIRNATGQLVSNSPVSIKISIIQGSANGSVRYVETHTKTTNVNGLVSLEIGGGLAILGTFPGINWANGPYFLKTETDVSGGSNYTLSATSQLLSVPYALYAEKAGNIPSSYWNADQTGIFYNNGKVGIGLPASNAGNTTAVLTVKGAVDQYSDDTFQTVQRFRNNTSNQEYQFNVSGSNNIDFAEKSFGIFNATKLLWVLNTEGNTNNVAIGSYTYKQEIPKSKLHVFNGDININDIGKGIIMKSPNGQCWRITVSNTGTLVSSAIPCP
jgi:hypothetical protein